MKQRGVIAKLIVLFLFIINISVFCIENDSTNSCKKNSSIIYQNIIPATFIISGAILSENKIKYEWQEKFPRTDTHIDDFLWLVPTAAMYSLNICGYEGENNWFDQSKYLGISLCANYIIVNAIKYGVGETRPDSSNNYSFPSAHTSLAFVSATALYHEYKDINPYIAYGGYLFAGATGILRITNNKHFTSDVLAGAGIGMLVTNLVYYFKPLETWQPFENSDVSMQCYSSGNGLGLAVHF